MYRKCCLALFCLYCDFFTSNRQVLFQLLNLRKLLDTLTILKINVLRVIWRHKKQNCCLWTNINYYIKVKLNKAWPFSIGVFLSAQQEPEYYFKLLISWNKTHKFLIAVTGVQGLLLSHCGCLFCHQSSHQFFFQPKFDQPQRNNRAKSDK